MEKSVNNKKRSPWLSKITSREQAAGMTRECGYALLFLAVVQIGFSFVYGYSLLAHAAILALGGLAVLRWRSRAAAIMLLVYGMVAASMTFAIHAGMPIPGNRNISLALIALWTTIKTVEATFRLQGRFAYPPGTAPAEPSAT